MKCAHFRIAVVLALLAGVVELTGGLALATSSKPVISGFAATPATSRGGPTTVTASTSSATECRLSSNKPVSGLPVSFPCGSGTVEREITMPADPALKPVKYLLTLTATASPRSTKAKTSVTVGPSPMSIAAGGDHACVVLRGGHISCWGAGEQAALGNGKQRNESTPVEVSGVSDAAQVSAGGWFTCALLSTGHVRLLGHR